MVVKKISPPKAGRPKGSKRFDPTVASTFGAVVRAARIEIGLSQDAFAYQAGLDRTYLGRIERGTCDPSLSSLLKISSALRVTATGLIGKLEEALEISG